MEDWRLLDQNDFLKNKKLRKCSWFSNKADWDHDHCEFCSVKISNLPDCLEEAYVTAEDGDHWVCPDCFNDFRLQFKWTLAS